MIIQLHSKTGIETVDTDKLTIQQLTDKGLDYIAKDRELKQRWANATTLVQLKDILGERLGIK